MEGGQILKKGCMNGVIHEGMPGASFTISFNCLADLVSIIMLVLSMALEGGLGVYPRKISPKTEQFRQSYWS